MGEEGLEFSFVNPIDVGADLYVWRCYVVCMLCACVVRYVHKISRSIVNEGSGLFRMLGVTERNTKVAICTQVEDRGAAEIRIKEKEIWRFLKVTRKQRLDASVFHLVLRSLCLSSWFLHHWGLIHHPSSLIYARAIAGAELEIQDGDASFSEVARSTGWWRDDCEAIYAGGSLFDRRCCRWARPRAGQEGQGQADVSRGCCWIARADEAASVVDVGIGVATNGCCANRIDVE